MTREFYAPPAFLVEDIVKNALKEDFGHGWDVTSQIVIPENTQATVQMTAPRKIFLWLVFPVLWRHYV